MPKREASCKLRLSRRDWCPFCLEVKFHSPVKWAHLVFMHRLEFERERAGRQCGNAKRQWFGLYFTIIKYRSAVPADAWPQSLDRR